MPAQVTYDRPQLSSYFLTTFLVFIAGLVLTVSLAVGIGASGRVCRYLQQEQNVKSEREKSRRSGLIYEAFR